MRTALKFLSVFVVLVLSCSALFIPTSAAAVGQVDVRYSVEKYTGVDAYDKEATDIYALTVSLKADHPINSMLLPIYYEKDLFTPVDGSDMSILDWDYLVDYDSGLTRAAYALPEGSDLLDTNKYNKALASAADRVVNARGAISGLGRSTVAAAITNLDIDRYDVHPNWWAGVDPEKYGIVKLQFSGQNNYCNIQASGEFRPLLQILFKLNDGVTDKQVEGALFGYVPGATYFVDVTVETEPLKFYYDGTSTSGMPSTTANYCAVEAEAPAGPVVEKDRAQVKMTATSATTVADAFTFRVISKITDADWDTYFANTGTDDVSVNAIQKLGFVAYKGTEGFNMDTAKAVAMGTATDANYEAKYTDYVQKVDESSDAYFGARIEFTSAETRTDVTYVGVVEYKDAAGETAYAFYPAEYTAALESNFDAIAAAYLAQYPYAG